MRMFFAFFAASDCSIESVMTRLFSTESRMRSTAGPDSTPWVM